MILPSGCKIEEVHGFLRYVCFHEERNQITTTQYKCVYTDEFYTFTNAYLYYFSFRGNTCSNDPHFYQACDKRMGYSKVTNNELLCEHYLCEKSEILMPSYIPDLMSSKRCEFDCENTDLNKKECMDNETAVLPSGQHVRPDEICNDVCDIAASCEDEAMCNNYLYGVYCLCGIDTCYVPPLRICDGIQTCDNGEDEENCTVNTDTEASCTHFSGNPVPIHNNIKCGPVEGSPYKYHAIFSLQVYCKWDEVASYQTNCSDPAKVALTCEINGYHSSVSKYLICFDDTINACDDHIDSSCFETKSCRVHKHLVCDQNKDCDDNADEDHPICLSTTEDTCKRRVGVQNDLPIPISWLHDGVWDCVDGIDEIADWPKCGIGKTSRYMSSNENKCENVFVCRTGIPGYELLQGLCDGFEKCGNENNICSVLSRSQSLKTTAPTTNKYKELTKTLSFCLKGLNSLELLFDTCVNKQFIYPDGDVFGELEKTFVILPNSKQSCDYMYGEQYLYTSCTNGCLEASCPLRNIPRYEVCPDQFPDRIGTIVDNKYLIFLTKSFGTVYTNRYFVCDNKIKCIDYSKVCNLVDDCKDGSDEIHCTNHFKCISSGKLLVKSRKCDGHIDCADLSDECNEQCSNTVLKGAFLEGISWFIGLSAVVANFVIIWKSLRTIKRCRTLAALMNRMLIILVALGDFLIGCYLFIIAIYDAIIFKNDYCQRQITWITSFECSLIGVFSTIGSQLSLFSMTGLSIVRLHGIWNSMRIPGEVTSIQIIKIVVTMILIIVASATIAAIPIIENFEDFFANGVRFSDRLKIFVGTPDKETLTEIIQAYYGRTRPGITLRWKMLIKMARNMFSHDLDYEDLTQEVKKLDFYGNDGVCLFKYFVQDQDPQKLFVWSVLSINFICFAFISISYLLIGILSHQSSNSLASSNNNRQIAQRNNRMNRRIAIIIITDFLCWVPFIVICIFHSSGLIDATPWYSIFSMIILPINSVINPFLYDNVVFNILRAPLRFFSAIATNSAIFQSFRQRVVPATAEDITLERRGPDV